MTGNGYIQRVLSWLGFIDGTCTEEAPNRRGAHISPSLGSRSTIHNGCTEELPSGKELPVRTRTQIATSVVQCLFGVTSVIIALALNSMVACSTDTEGNFMFGNACQDRLFGAQFLLIVVGAWFIIMSLRGIWRQAK